MGTAVFPVPLRRICRDHRGGAGGAKNTRPTEGCGMNRFDYVRPASVADAIAAASMPNSAYLAAPA